MAVEYETLVQGGHSKLVEEIFKKVKARTAALDEISDDVQSAQTAASTATEKALEAAQSATSASQSASAASDSADSAAQSAQEARNYSPEGIADFVDDVSYLKSASNKLDDAVFGEKMTDASTILTNNNGVVTNNNDGTYTIGTADYGVTIFGSQMTLEPGEYALYGVPNGFSFLSTSTNLNDKFLRNDFNTPLWFEVNETKQCYLGFRIGSNPSTSFVITPYLRKKGIEKITFDLQGDLDEIVDELSGLESALTGVGNEIYSYTQKAVTASADGWRLNESDGLCSSNPAYKLVKYTVAAGDIVKVVSDDRFQFQTVASVPSSGSNNRVGATYGAGSFILAVPETATYLIVSTPTTSSAAVFDVVSIVDGLQSAFDTLMTEQNDEWN